MNSTQVWVTYTIVCEVDTKETQSKDIVKFQSNVIIK